MYCAGGRQGKGVELPAGKGSQDAGAQVLSWHRLAGEDALHGTKAQRGFLIRRQHLSLERWRRLPLHDGLGRGLCGLARQGLLGLRSRRLAVLWRSLH